MTRSALNSSPASPVQTRAYSFLPRPRQTPSNLWEIFVSRLSLRIEPGSSSPRLVSSKEDLAGTVTEVANSPDVAARVGFACEAKEQSRICRLADSAIPAPSPPTASCLGSDHTGPWGETPLGWASWKSLGPREARSGPQAGSVYKVKRTPGSPPGHLDPSYQGGCSWGAGVFRSTMHRRLSFLGHQFYSHIWDTQCPLEIKGPGCEVRSKLCRLFPGLAILPLRCPLPSSTKQR